MQNKAFIYKSLPHGYPVPGKDITIEDRPIDLSQPAPPSGLLVKNYYASLYPSQRGRMRDPSISSYSAAFEPNTPVISVGLVAKVLKSDCEQFKQGDWVRTSLCETQEYNALPAERMKFVDKLEKEKDLPLSMYVGVLGMPGMTAYGSLYEIGQPKRGETIFVSAASGAVGQLYVPISSFLSTARGNTHFLSY